MDNTLNILLAEDNPVNQKVAVLLLNRLGYQVDVVRTGLEALQALRIKSYDVVLMDVYMPEMDGIDAARQIYQEFHPSIRPRIVALTASTEEGDRQQCLEAGMDDYISKPLRPQELSRVLQQCQPIAIR